MRLLMIGHLIGDFYLQTNRLVQEKKAIERVTYMRGLAIHSLVYLIAMYAFMVISTGSFTVSMFPVLIAGVTHGIIDFAKVTVEKTYDRFQKQEWITFTIDQLLHITVLYTLDCIYNIHADFTWMPDQIECFIMQHPDILTVLLAVLICGKPAAIAVAVIFKTIPHTMENASKMDRFAVENKNNLQKMGDELQKKTQQKDQSLINEEQEVEAAQIGSWIGILEREIMLMLALMGQYGAIGFVLTAKSLARFKQLENKAFAEKYLLGTLLSSGIALLCIAMCMVL